MVPWGWQEKGSVSVGVYSGHDLCIHSPSHEWVSLFRGKEEVHVDLVLPIPPTHSSFNILSLELLCLYLLESENLLVNLR